MPPGANAFNYLIPSAFTLAPGETRVYSPVGITGIGDGNLNLSPGYRPGTGHSVNISSYLGPLDATDPVKVDVVFDSRFKEEEGKPEFVGVWLDMFLGASQNVPHYLQVNRMQYLQGLANKYWPPIPATELASPTAEQIDGIWQPFLSAVYGTRISGPSSTGLPGKGLLQASPLVSYARLEGNYADQRGGSAAGAAHPANAASDFSFFKHTGFDDKLPNFNNANNRGFIVSGFTAADGLSRLILDAPASGREDYRVNIHFQPPGHARTEPLCETRWTHDTRSRTVFFVLKSDDSAIPRILGFADFRGETPTNP